MKFNITFTAFIAAILMLCTPFATAQTVLEQAAEHRYQIDFRVNDAALAKMLPAGWETVIATEGPAKDCNLRMIFIDRMAIMADGGSGEVARPFAASPPPARLAWAMACAC